MANETPFRITVAVALITFVVVRMYFQVKLRTPRRSLADSRDGLATRLLLPILGLVSLSPLVWLIRPDWLSGAAVPLPDWLRWGGVLAAVAGVTLLAWAHQALGANFSTMLTLQSRHQLISSGPYRFVRHPMYSAILLWDLGVALMAANAVVFALPLMFALFFALRVAPEERLMADAFGDTFYSYCQRTGRFVPRIPW